VRVPRVKHQQSFRMNQPYFQMNRSRQKMIQWKRSFLQSCQSEYLNSEDRLPEWRLQPIRQIRTCKEMI
jgi:hypothetical protein